MVAHSLRLKEGDVFADRYRIDGVVGKGGYGAVYRATDRVTGGLVALKVLLANYGSSDNDSRRFKREAALVKTLEHPNIVTLLDFGQSERGVPYIAFELLRGKALGTAVEEEGPFDLGRTVRLGLDVLRALDTAHARGVIHRDVKPQNVFLLDEAPWTKVLDFGVAKALKGEESTATQLTESGQMVGTPHYMAPEQVRGTGAYPSSDLYSLGLVLTEVLTGVRVLREEALINVYLAHVSASRLPLDPRVLESPIGPILLRATEKDPSKRYGAAAEMLAELARIPSDSTWRVAPGRSTLPLASSEVPPDEKVTRPMQAVADRRGPARPIPLGVGKTIVMDDLDDTADGSTTPSVGALAMAQLSSGGAAPTSGAPTSVGSAALSSSRPASIAPPPQHGGLVAEAGSQGAALGIWGPPSPRPVAPAALPPVPAPPLGPSAAGPTASQGLKIAVAVVFLLVIVGSGVALALLTRR